MRIWRRFSIDRIFRLIHLPALRGEMIMMTGLIRRTREWKGRFISLVRRSYFM